MLADETKFITHLTEYGISYGTPEEYKFRLAIFKENDEFIEKINSEQDSYKIGHNEFSTWTEYERNKRLSKVPYKKNNILPKFEVKSDVEAVPIDWRKHGAVTPVYNTGQCANAWLWNSIDEIQSSAYIHHGELHDLSKQQVIDCYTKDLHCNGAGDVEGVLGYVAKHGMMSAQDYPYTGEVGTCQY